LHLGRGSKQADRRPASEDQVEARLIELGKKYNLASSATSFVAVEERADPVTGEVQLRKIPIALTRGWGGIVSTPMNAVAGPAPAGVLFDMFQVMPTAGVIRSKRMAPPTTPSLALLMLQQSAGYWNLTDELLKLIESPETVQALTGRLGASLTTKAGQRTLATWLALVWLEANAFGERDTWRLAATKAREWIKKSGAQAPDGKTWEEVAREILS
jgi:hypothetical protein